MQARAWVFKGLLTIGLMVSAAGGSATDRGRVVWLVELTQDQLFASIEYDDEGADFDRCGPRDNTIYLWWNRLDPDHQEKFVMLQTALVTGGLVGAFISFNYQDCRGFYNYLEGVGLYGEGP